MYGVFKSYLERIYQIIIAFLSSNHFFYGVLALVVLQGAWYALSFQPTLFDEGKHLSKIYIHSQSLDPFIGSQKPSWDYVGAVSRDGSFFYYYLMSWPLRLIQLFTDSRFIQIIFLRLINIAFFVGGIAVYRKVLLSASNAPKSLVHVILLFFVITPLVALLPGAVNYDNLVFLLFAFILLLSIRLIKSKNVGLIDLSGIIILALLMSIVKWTSIALLVPVVIFLGYFLYKKYGLPFFTLLQQSVKQLSKPVLIFISVSFLLVVGMFIERPLMNTLEYGRPNPTCDMVISRDRCMKFDEFAIYAEVGAKKPTDFQPINIAEYAYVYWLPRMINTHVSILPWEASKLRSALPVMKILYFIFSFAGIALLLVYLRDYLKNKIYLFLLLVMAGYSVILLIFLYSAYKRHGIPAATSGRYLLPVAPIFLYFVGLSLTKLFGKYKKTLVLFMCLVLVMFSQGGGVITHSLTAQDRLYWQNNTTIKVNERLQEFLRPLVKGG